MTIISQSIETKPLFDVTSELLSVVEERQRQGGVNLIGLPTGYEDVDYTLGGWRNDEMYSIGGITGSGKSSFCLSAAIHVAQAGGSVFYLSLEMSAQILALRTLSAMTGVPAMNIEKGQLKPETLKLIQDAADTFKGLPLYFYDRSTTSEGLKDILDVQKDRYGLHMAVIDYIALLQDKGNSPYERVTNISINIRSHARDYDIPLLAVSQLNRAALHRGGRPVLQDLKETGQIENDSGAVIFPYRPHSEVDDNGNPIPDLEVERAELIIAKNRHGPSDVVIPVEFLPKQMIWRPIKAEVKDPPSAQREKRSI